MNEPWNLKQSDTREANTLTTFILFCEDEVSEPNYFNYFKTDKIKINTITKQRSMMSNVLSAVHHCKTHGLFEQIEDDFHLKDSGLQVWCVFDRDKGAEGKSIPEGNTEFDEAIRTAEGKGIKVAWSNDAFELWILLHFEEITIDDIAYQERIACYDRLTEIFNALPNNEYLDKAKKHASFSYKKDLKQRLKFLTIVRSEIEDKIDLAIERAKKLEEICNAQYTYNHQKAPCTLVHHLVEALVEVGGKQIEKVDPLS